MSATAPALKASIPYDASSAVVFGQQAQRMLTAAEEYTIDSDDLFAAAGEDLQRIKALQKNVEDTRKTIADPLFRAKQAVDALFKGPAEFLTKAENVLKRSMLAYQTEQERKAAEARRIAEEAARVERERLAAEERARQQAAEKARHEAEAAAAAGDAAAAQEAAARAEQAEAEAEAVAQEAAVITMPVAVAAPARVTGISTRTTYSAQVDDLLELVKAVATGKAPIEALQPNTVFLGAQARAFKKAGPLYPGVTVVGDRGLSARAA